MAYVKRNSGSDVELRSVHDGSVECSRCLLDADQYSVYLDQHSVVAHLETHREAGHKVPLAVMLRFAQIAGG